MGGYNIYNGKYKPVARRSLISYFLVGMSGALIGGILVLTLAPAVLLGRVVPYDTNIKSSTSDDTSDGTEEQAEAVYKSQRNEEISIVAAAVQKVMPAVVSIWWEEIKDNNFSAGSKSSDTCTGVIVDSKGYILTNSHGNSGSTGISVYLSDGRSYPARIIWEDEDLNLSVLKINAENLTAGEMGDLNSVVIGEPVLAVGSPTRMKFERSLTSGIISALNRTMPLDGELMMEDLIETDASINEDNNGGPLINSEGYIIGINTVKVKSNEGLGYAIPINLVVPVIKSIVDTGVFRTPYLGITTGLDRESASLYDYELDRGIFIESIDEKSPAYEAGLRKGDIILEINNVRMDTAVSLKQVIFEAGAGNEINIKYLDGQKKERIVAVKLGEL